MTLFLCLEWHPPKKKSVSKDFTIMQQRWRKKYKEMLIMYESAAFESLISNTDYLREMQLNSDYFPATHCLENMINF